MAFKFRYGVDSSVVEGAEALLRQNEKAFRAEYSRMRTAAQHRIERLGEKYSHSKTYQQFQQGFQKLKDIDQRDLAKAYAELYKFMQAKSSTVSGQKEIQQKTIATFQKQGLNLNEGNYKQAISIFEEMRKKKMVYGSDKVVQLADAMSKLNKRQQRTWLNHLQDLLPKADQLQEIPSLRGVSFANVVKMLGD